VRTYLTEKARYVSECATLRGVLVVPGPFDGYALGDGVRTYRLHGPRIPTQTAYRFLFATRSTRRIVEHERPDLIEVGSPFFVPWVTALASRRVRTPMVAFHHTSLAGVPTSLAMRSGTRALSLLLAGAYLRRLNRLFRTTIVASDYAAGELQRLGIERTSRVSLGVDLEHFHPRRREWRDRTRRRFGLPTDRPLVLYIGRLAPEKSLEVVLDAWRAVSRQTGARLVIAGAGPYVGEREMVARLHACADVYVSPGPVETFGLSTLEAMASGVPVVTAAHGGAWELVQRSQAGVGYEPGNAGDAARALTAMLTGDGPALGALGRAYAEREHGWHTVFDRLFAVYREVLQR
jgi:alpha-1,6-mannosyltransferase